VLAFHPPAQAVVSAAHPAPAATDDHPPDHLPVDFHFQESQDSPDDFHFPVFPVCFRFQDPLPGARSPEFPDDCHFPEFPDDCHFPEFPDDCHSLEFPVYNQAYPAGSQDDPAL